MLPPTPSPLLNHCTIQTAKTHLPQPTCALLPPPLFWPTPVPLTSCCVSLFCLLSPTSYTLPPSHLCPSPYPMGPSSPLNLAATYTFHASRFPSHFGPPLTPYSHTHSWLSPSSFKLPARVSSLPLHSLSMPQETRHPFSLALNKPVRMCGDSTYHPHPPLNPHPTPPT